MIRRTFEWISRHRKLNALLVFAYAFFLVFAHDVFVNLSIDIMNSLSLTVYNQVVAFVIALSAITLAGISVVVYRNGPDLKSLAYFLGTLLLLVTHFFVLTEMNIEFIHAIMYGAFAVLIFPLVGRYGGAVVLGLPLMLVDEWYQHVILYPDSTDFYELNDIVLDLLGAGLFISLIQLLGVHAKKASTPLIQRTELWVLLVLVVAVIGAITSCFITPYVEDACSNTWLVLNKLPEMNEFWYVHPRIGSTLHVLKPIEGLLLQLLLVLGYLTMDWSRTDR